MESLKVHQSSIIKCFLEEQPYTKIRNDLLNIIDMEKEYRLVTLRQTPGKGGFENTEGLLLLNIAKLDHDLPRKKRRIPQNIPENLCQTRRG